MKAAAKGQWEPAYFDAPKNAMLFHFLILRWLEALQSPSAPAMDRQLGGLNGKPQSSEICRRTSMKHL
jgi:hypothetical protein